MARLRPSKAQLKTNGKKLAAQQSVLRDSGWRPPPRPRAHPPAAAW